MISDGRKRARAQSESGGKVGKEGEEGVWGELDDCYWLSACRWGSMAKCSAQPDHRKKKKKCIISKVMACIAVVFLQMYLVNSVRAGWWYGHGRVVCINIHISGVCVMTVFLRWCVACRCACACSCCRVCLMHQHLHSNCRNTWPRR